MLELHGMKYIITCRKPNKKVVAYGGAAIIANQEKFSLENYQSTSLKMWKLFGGYYGLKILALNSRQ